MKLFFLSLVAAAALLVSATPATADEVGATIICTLEDYSTPWGFNGLVVKVHGATSDGLINDNDYLIIENYDNPLFSYWSIPDAIEQCKKIEKEALCGTHTHFAPGGGFVVSHVTAVRFTSETIEGGYSEFITCPGN